MLTMNIEKYIKNDINLLQITNIINKIVFLPKEIILFGSRALGKEKSYSDYDILVILKIEEIDKSLISKWQIQIRKTCAKADLDVDILIRDKKYVDDMSKFYGNVIYDAINEGVKIMTKKDYVQLWTNKADNDLKVAKRELTYEDSVLEAVCFHLQQAVEKY